MCRGGSKWRHLVLQLWPSRRVSCVYVPSLFESTIKHNPNPFLIAYYMHGSYIYYAWGLYLPVSVNVMLEGVAFTSQIQISWMYYNCFVYIVREGIKGVLGPWRRRRILCWWLCPVWLGMVLLSGVAYESLGFYAVKPEQIYHADSRNLPCVRSDSL